MKGIDELIEKGWKLDLGENELISYFRDLYETYPGNARLAYEYGGVFDSLGMEKEAIPLYQEALKLGIDGPFRIKTLIQMGSTYRNLNKFEESMELLEMAVEESGGDPAAIIFLSLTLLSSGKEKDAALLALRHICEKENGLVKRYRNSIENYLNELE